MFTPLRTGLLLSVKSKSADAVRANIRGRKRLSFRAEGEESGPFESPSSLPRLRSGPCAPRDDTADTQQIAFNPGSRTKPWRTCFLPACGEYSRVWRIPLCRVDFQSNWLPAAQ